MTSNKYARLNEFLSSKKEDEIALSFDELERLIDSPLPASARLHAAWWANQNPPSSQSRSWMSAGWRAFPNLKTATVSFTRASGKAIAPVISGPVTSKTQSLEHDLQEDEVKEHLRAYMGHDGWQVTVISGKARGIDIEAFRDGKRWIIEVKGCGSLQPMRVNYFLGALGELLQRMNDPNAKYSVAFPDLPQFRGLWDRLPRLAKQRTGISCLFVRTDGAVIEVE